MNVVPEWNFNGNQDADVLEPADSGAVVAPDQPESSAGPAISDSSGAEPSESSGELIAGIAASVQELADSAQRYHIRAEQRENVIDHLSAEVDRLRRGERRGMLRPLLVEICRLRNDLLRQAAELPPDFDTDRASLLLTSYAESVELALENNGVVSFAPDSGDAFDPRMHRRVGAEAALDPAFAGRIAQVRRDGYLDVDANSPIAPAEVVVFAAVAPKAYEDEREEQ
jgi:molecular chaperone GrpE